MTDSIGELSITLDGKVIPLSCNVTIAKRVNAYAGGQGLIAILGKLGAMDFDTYVAVVAAALDKKMIDVEGKVYRAGMVSLTADLAMFVTYLSNGGRPVQPAKDGELAA